MCMGGPKIPAAAAPVAPTPPPPTPVDPSVLAARQDAMSGAQRAAGLQSTILTGANPTDAQSTATKKTLLGQ